MGEYSYKLSQVARRSLELVSQQIIRLENRMPISDLKRIKTLPDDSDEWPTLYRKHLTEIEFWDLQLWVIIRHCVRVAFKEVLPEPEKKNLDMSVKIIESIREKDDHE